MEDELRIGVITSPHGVHGEVKVYPTTDDPNRFQTVGFVTVESKGQRTRMDITSVKYFKGMVILKLSGIATRDDAELFRNADLWILRSQSSPCREGEYFIADIIGMEVYTEEGQRVGTVTDVYETGANNVYEVRKEDGKELLLPVIPSCIRNVSVPEKRMTVHILPGLEEL